MQSLVVKRVAALSTLRASVMNMSQAVSFSTGGKKGPLDGKQKGDEKVFFDKEDQAALRKLLKKLNDQEKQAKAEVGSIEKHEKALEKVFFDHKIDGDKHKDFFQALLEWRK